MIIVLVMHGMPPKDFPIADKREFMRLHAQIEDATGGPHKVRHDSLDRRMRAWPRTPENDPFHAASYQLQAELERASGVKVLVSFNEYCSPNVPEVLDAAAEADKEVVVVTPMLIRGGSHAEKDIPELVEAAQQRHPDVAIRYVWPFDSAHIASFLNAHIQQGAARS